MDEIDEGLIESVDGGVIKYTTLAKKMNLPLSTVHFRMKRLERERIIKYYRGEIDWRKAGFSITAIVLITVDTKLLKNMGKSQDQLLKELLQIIYVREGFVTTGDMDMVVKIIARDPPHLKELVLDYIQAKDGITNTNTMIVLE